jgi:uncharacterized protein (DUF488 family)
MERQRDIYTIGHSTHEIDRFTALLRDAGIAAVADVRRYPGSRRNPQFNADALASALEAEGMHLHPFADTLGGRRHTRPDSPNGGWRVEAFRAYADHMASPEFAAGLRDLAELAGRSTAAVMCAEADWHRCHRRLVADALLVAGWRVRHVWPDGRIQDHELPPFAMVEDGRITYPPAQGRLA